MCPLALILFLSVEKEKAYQGAGDRHRLDVPRSRQALDSIIQIPET